MSERTDFVVIGGGLVGLATAFALSERYPDRRIEVLEKEAGPAVHQSGRNSGVIHSGVYYTPGSLKARLCTNGRTRLEQFCMEHGVSFERCGKVIVARTPSEIPRLEAIAERGAANGVSCRLIGPQELSEFEPHTRGVQALHVPETGIVDFPGVARALADVVRERGHGIRYGAEVTSLVPGQEAARIGFGDIEMEAGVVINCAGLQSDRVARLAGADPGMQIIPFRGVYYELRPEARQVCRNLIYPVPDPAYPFLGVHLTRMIDGRVEVGPNAVVATGREGYSFGEGNVGDLMETLAWPGFLKLSRRHWRKGLSEIGRTLSKRWYAREVRRLVPSVGSSDLVPCRSGIRAQALDRDGNLVEDFVFIDQPGIVHVCNAPSPAATSCLSIGEEVAARAGTRLN